MAMDLSLVMHETHTRAISALGYNAGRRELMIGYEGTVTTYAHNYSHHLLPSYHPSFFHLF